MTEAPRPIDSLDPPRQGVTTAPFLRAPEAARTIFIVTLAAACAPLVAGLILFGWYAAVVSALCIGSCVILERLYYRVTRTPALLGRTHAYLTGVLLALTMPPFVPWYIPVVAAAFAIIVGKAIFGGVGHFLWQPALVGRVAVAVIFLTTLTPTYWPILARDKLLNGDIRAAQRLERSDQWSTSVAPDGADAFSMRPPADILAGLTSTDDVPYSGLASIHPKRLRVALNTSPQQHVPRLRGAIMPNLPPLREMLLGTRPGGIGETCAVVILVAGVYLIYRGYVKWQLPLAFIASAAAVVAVAPVHLATGSDGHVAWKWLPLVFEGADTGFTYVLYQLLSGELLLAAMFLAPEMTSRPVTTGGQVIFGVGCGVAAMLLRLYVDLPVPCYTAILIMNSFTPKIDRLWRPHSLGQPAWRWFGRTPPASRP
ncbi:MAG: RnfABCDGE type electron transport complex subunit D [Planctomycetaceae bacterium]|nr:RnfABCDGE type electron transport complex subunit D [Planctomycetaceae bacterium]